MFQASTGANVTPTRLGSFLTYGKHPGGKHPGAEVDVFRVGIAWKGHPSGL